MSLLISGSSLAFSAPSVSVPAYDHARSGGISMGFGPSAKELSTDPPISETIAKAKVYQQARLAMQALMTSSNSFVPGGAELARSLPGKGPTGYFDPFDLTPENQRTVVIWREAELMHCRVSMLAVVGFLVGESGVHLPMVTAPLAVDQLVQTPALLWSSVLMAIGFTEIFRIKRGWVQADYNTPTSELLALKPGYKPGNLGFDPLKLLPSDPVGRALMEEKELNNGRLSMVAFAGLVGQELVTGAPIFA